METDDLELGYYGLALKRRWWLVALATVLTMLFAVAVVPRQETTYSSTATVLIEPVSLDAIEGIDSRSATVNETTEASIARSAPVIGNVLDAMNLDLSVDEFRKNLTVVGEDGSQLLAITYEGEVKIEAAGIAEAVGDEYLSFREGRFTDQRDQRVEAYDALIQPLDDQLDGLRQDYGVALVPDANGLIDQAVLARIDSELRQLQAERVDLVEAKNRLRLADLDGGEPLGEATAPEEIQTGIDRLLALVVATVMGLLGGVALALFVDRFDRRVRDDDDVEHELEAPVVGNIPRISEETPVLVTAVRTETAGANAFRRFGTAVLAGGGDNLHSLLITSANEKEGRTTAVVNTALALRQAGRLVYLVSSDRQNPDIDNVFGLTGLEGLDHFFRSEATPADVARLFDQAPNQLGLRLIASGTGNRVPQPLSVAGLRAILAEGERRGAVMVFDAPPALAHPDGLSIASLVDATYVVVGRGRSRRQDLTELRMQLRHVNANVAGAVRNHSSRWKVNRPGSLTAVASSVDEQLPNAS
ncbi:MAG: hypothetical protein HKN26_16065 [Acidimicrobiales bacterium]|nr:hypothetical protein [Acidimicrobiales bacterium]